MANFTPQEFINKLRRQIATVKADNKPLALAASTTHDAYVDRIFVQGQTSQGGDIVPQRSMKTPRRGAYSRSYAKRREEAGRQTDKVNLVFEGLLFANVASSLQKQGDTWVTGTTRQTESDKIDHLIALYGEVVFLLSADEKKLYLATIQAEFSKNMKS